MIGAAPRTLSAHTPRRLTILGSTGSIGMQTLALVKEHPARFTVAALTAHNNVERLIEQALEFQPERVVIGNEAHYLTLKAALQHTSIIVETGEEALINAATINADMVIAGIVGAAGLKPVFAAIREGRRIAIANKEPLVCAGNLILQEARHYGATLLPVDSEHNAIFQVFAFDQLDAIEAITLTASGGPFREFSREQMRHVTPEQAVKHPNWEMGAKISVDSATMINKGLEMIEAYHLFPLSPEQIRVVVHPQSVVHGLVHYRDGSVLAQLGPSDMTVPIAHALAWPQRMPTSAQRLSLETIGTLEFHSPDEQRFPGLRLAREVLAEGQSAAIIFNAANEIAVERFLKKEIGFLCITDVIAHCLDKMSWPAVKDLESIIALDNEVRLHARHYKETH
jgi:1-deoxy-D-xylulose-5-phosphate reductoisomerase